MANFSEMDQVRIQKVRENTVLFRGHWLTAQIERVQELLKDTHWPCTETIIFDLSLIAALDVNGALMLYEQAQQLEATGRKVDVISTKEQVLQTYALARQYRPETKTEHHAKRFWLVRELDRIGRLACDKCDQAICLLSFLGQVAVRTWGALPISPRSFKQFLIHIERTGAHALGIVGLLSFLVGFIIAYQMGLQLEQYGGSIYIVDLSAFAVLREFGPLITAIIFSGRTGSAITAQLASMKLSEEIAALEVMGISPYERLVLPRIFALMVTLPLVTIWANITGIFGAMIMSHHLFDINFYTFWERVSYTISLRTYLIGMVKTPVFALIIGIVGCYQGLTVGRSSDAVGQKTTLSVVQSIFLIIVADAIFSVLFSWRTL